MQLVLGPVVAGEVPHHPAEAQHGHQVDGERGIAPLRPQSHEKRAASHERGGDGEHDDGDQRDQHPHPVGGIEGDGRVPLQALLGPTQGPERLDQANVGESLLHRGGQIRGRGAVDEGAGSHARHRPGGPQQRRRHQDAGDEPEPGAQQGHQRDAAVVAHHRQRHADQVPHHGGDHGAVLVDAVDRVAGAVAAVVVHGQRVPARKQVQAQVLVDALHDPHVVVGVEDAQRQPAKMGAQGDDHVGPLEVVALLLGERLDGPGGELRIAEQGGEARRQRFRLQQALVEQVRQHHGEEQVQKTLEEIDGVEGHQVRAHPDAAGDASVRDAKLHQPPQDRGADQGEDVQARRVGVDQKHARENRADGSDQKGGDADALQHAPGVVHHERADHDDCHRDVERGGGSGARSIGADLAEPGEAGFGPPRRRPQERHHGYQQRRIGAVAVAARERRHALLDANARVPPLAQEAWPNVGPGAQQQQQNVAEAVGVVGEAPVAFERHVAVPEHRQLPRPSAVAGVQLRGVRHAVGCRSGRLLAAAHGEPLGEAPPASAHAWQDLPRCGGPLSAVAIGPSPAAPAPRRTRGNLQGFTAAAKRLLHALCARPGRPDAGPSGPRPQRPTGASGHLEAERFVAGVADGCRHRLLAVRAQRHDGAAAATAGEFGPRRPVAAGDLGECL